MTSFLQYIVEARTLRRTLQFFYLSKRGRFDEHKCANKYGEQLRTVFVIFVI